MGRVSESLKDASLGFWATREGSFGEPCGRQSVRSGLGAIIAGLCALSLLAGGCRGSEATGRPTSGPAKIDSPRVPGAAVAEQSDAGRNDAGRASATPARARSGKAARGRRPITGPKRGEGRVWKGPRLATKSLTADFGEAWSGPYARAVFHFRNAGDETLEIIQVKPRCGCTTAGPFTRRISPGQDGQIAFKVKTIGMKGHLSKRVQITSNDPRRRAFYVNVTGRVKPYLSFQPKNGLSFGAVRPGREVTRVLTVRSQVGEPIDLEVEQPDPGAPITAKLEPVKKGREWKLSVTVHPPATPGNKVMPITLRPSRPDLPPRTLNPSMFVRPVISVKPSPVRVRPRPNGPSKTTVRVLAVRENFEVRSVTSSDPELEVTPPRRLNGRAFAFDVVAPPGYRPGRNVVITIETDHPDQPHFDVPVTLSAKPSGRTGKKPRSPKARRKAAGR